MTRGEMLLCGSFSLALPVGQVMFKSAAVYFEKQTGPLILKLMTNWPLLGAFAWYGVSSLLWFYILTRVPLSKAYPFALAGTGLVPILAWLLFKEPMTWRISVGFALMLAGLFVVQSQSA